MKQTHQYWARDQTAVGKRAPACDKALAADRRRRTRERKPRAGVEPSEEGPLKLAKGVPERPAEEADQPKRKYNWAPASLPEPAPEPRCFFICEKQPGRAGAKAASGDIFLVEIAVDIESL